MENYKDLPFREPALEWATEPLSLEEPFPETEPARAWNWELTAATTILVGLAAWAAVHSFTVLTGSMVRHSFEVTNAYIGLGFAATTLTAVALLLRRRKAGLLLTTLPLSFLAGTYLPFSFVLLYRVISGELGGGELLSGLMLLEFMVPLFCIGMLSLLCSPRSRALLKISSRSLAISLLFGLSSGVGFCGYMIWG